MPSTSIAEWLWVALSKKLSPRPTESTDQTQSRYTSECTPRLFGVTDPGWLSAEMRTVNGDGLEDHWGLIPVGWRPPSGGSVTTDVNCCLPIASHWQPRPLSNQHGNKGLSLSHGYLLGHSGGSQTRPETDLIAWTIMVWHRDNC